MSLRSISSLQLAVISGTQGRVVEAALAGPVAAEAEARSEQAAKG